MEFLRVCQREGLFRLERDRRGQIRVFAGSALQVPAVVTPHTHIEPQPHEVLEGEPVEPAVIAESSDSDLQTEDLAAMPPPPDVAAAAMEHEVAAPHLGDLEEQPAPPKTRRSRKAPAAGRPAARKSTGARVPARRRKTRVPAA
jgi:hypothetical protein